MPEPISLLAYVATTGIGATAVMDAWTQLQKRVFGVPVLDYAWVGRWLGHFVRGRFRHEAIDRAAPVTGERLIGWTAHYAIGVAFAALLPALWGAQWLRDPSPGPALAVGLATVAAPFLIMQPAMGKGVAASRTANPSLARRRSLATHLWFGLGLYVAAQAWAWLARAA